jgi:peroxiredoxin Q/BCP
VRGSLFQGDCVLRSGVQAPEFDVQLHTGEMFRLRDIRGKHHLVLFFYPKDFTYGCTKEVCSFRNHFGELTALGAVVLGVSRDPLESHKSFARWHALPFSLASDPDLRLARMYDIMGLGGLWLKRVTYVIDKELVIRRALHHEILVDAHWKRTIELLKTLNGPST